MRLLITGDWHVTDKCPENRIDNYEDTLFKKLEFIFGVANKNKCFGILQPGDLFDHYNPPYQLFIRLVELCKKYNHITLYTVFGQHDLRYRNKENSALSALRVVCDRVMPLEGGERCLPDDVYIGGVGFGEIIPDYIKDEEKDVLLIHKMIVDEKLWEGQTDCFDARSFLRLNKFDLIVSGDNHKFFIKKFNNRFLFNMGSLMRSNISQVDHQPTIAIFDTDTKQYQLIPIPIEPPEKVFKMEKLEREKIKNEKLEAFVKGLSEHKSMSMSFMDNLDAYMNKNDIDNGIRNIIKECANE